MARSAGAVVAGKRAASHRIAGRAHRLECQRVDRAVEAGVGAQGRVEAAIRIKPGQPRDEAITLRGKTARGDGIRPAYAARGARVIEGVAGHSGDRVGAVEGRVRSVVDPADHDHVTHRQTVRVERGELRGRGPQPLACHHRLAEANPAEVAAHQEAGGHTHPISQPHQSMHGTIGTRANPLGEGRATGEIQSPRAGQPRDAADGPLLKPGKAQRTDSRGSHVCRRPAVSEAVARRRRQRVSPIKRHVHPADGDGLPRSEAVIARRGERGGVRRQQLVGHRRAEGRAIEVATHEVGAGAVGRAIGDDRAHHRIRAGTGVERRVEAAVGVEPGDAVHHRAVDRREIAAEDNPAIRLHQQCTHLRVGTG